MDGEFFSKWQQNVDRIKGWSPTETPRVGLIGGIEGGCHETAL